MTVWTTKAIVLEAAPRGESDRELALLTPGQGRLSAVAKGALRSRRRFGGMFDPAQLVEVGLRVSRGNRVMVEHATLLNAFPAFRLGPCALARASLLIEVARGVAPEGEPLPGFFATLARGLARLHAEPEKDRFALGYAFRLLALAGYRPELLRCVRCPAPPLSPEPNFSPAAGGLLCAACLAFLRQTDPPSAGTIPVSLETVRTLAAIMDAPEPHLGRFRFSRRALGESRDLLLHFFAYHPGRPLRSLEFLTRNCPVGSGSGARKN